MNNRWKIVEYYIYTRTKQEDFVLKQVEVLIDAPEKAKKLCHILSGHKGAFDLAKGRYIVDGKSVIGVCTMDLSKPLTLTIHEEDDTVMEEIREFVVKGR